jgi:putative transposase
MAIARPNQMWCDDVTYILMAHGFLYLVPIMDLSSRRVMSFRRSNTLDADFCVEALQKAICQYDCPSIFNSD